jgi:hypothetical protein
MKIVMLLVLSASVFGQFDRDPLRDVLGDIEAARPARLLCTVPLAKSPAVRGKIRLGMTRAEYDVALITATGVSIGSPTFFEDRLIAFAVHYDESVKWDDRSEFAYVVADEFKLPPAAWRTNGQRGLVMFCDGWLMLAESNHLELRDEVTIRRMVKSAADTEKADAEEKKKAFKP